MNEYLNSKLRTAVKRLEAGKGKLLAIAQDVQAQCAHTRVVETPFKGSTMYGFAQMPMRMCLVCRFEEHSMYPWYHGNELGDHPDRHLTVVHDRTDFYKLRLPT